MSDERDDKRARGSPRRPAAQGSAASRESYRTFDEAGLVDAMRAADERAIDEFLTRYHRVMSDRARESRILAWHLEDAIVDVLQDVAVLIANGRVRPNRSIAAYLMATLRRRLMDQAEATSHREHAEQDAAADLPGEGERAVPSVVSESSWRSTYGPGFVPQPVPRVIERVVSMMEEGLAQEEQWILDALSSFVPQREICEWFGWSYTAGTQRIWRLRDRLRRTAISYADHFSQQEFAEVDAFFGRFLARSNDKGKRRGAPRGGER